MTTGGQQHADHLSDNLGHFLQQAEIRTRKYASTPVPGVLRSLTQKLREWHINVAVSSQLLHDPGTCRHVMTKLIRPPLHHIDPWSSGS